MATQKQKRAIKKVMENRGNVSKSMRDVGYSEKTAKNPKNLTDSKAWKNLMKKYLPDNFLGKTHQELLNAKQLLQINFDPEISDREIKEVIKSAGCVPLKIRLVEVEYTTKKGEVKTFEKKNCFYAAPNAIARQKALDMAYKLKGKYAPEKKEHSGRVELKKIFDEIEKDED